MTGGIHAGETAAAAATATTSGSSILSTTVATATATAPSFHSGDFSVVASNGSAKRCL